MRCNNCGWENPDGSQKCEKCNAPLQGGAASSSNPASYPNIDEIHSTIRENEPFGHPNATPYQDSTVRDYEPTVPNTGGTLRDETLRGSQQMGTPQPQHVTEPEKEDFGGTVNPYAGMGAYVPIPRCILKPIIFPGEDTRYAPKPVNIKGDHTELNRQMLDADNPTITSKVQAILTNKNGKWFIQNQSSQKTTFVFADEPVAVKSGDIILMGNRTFVFEED